MARDNHHMVRDIIISVIAVLVLFLIWVAVLDTNRFTLSKYKYTHPAIKKNFTAVVLSDLHNKRFGKDNEKLINAIDVLSPDIILIAGDMINGHPHENIEGTVSFLKNLASKYPVYYENGNHEMRLDLYRDKYGDQYDEFCGSIKEFGIKLLVNERVTLEDYGVTVIGSEINKKHYKRMGIVPMEEGELLKELGAPDENTCNILLAHNPDFFEDYVDYGADIVFSGHVHGGIVRIPIINKGILSPNATFFPKYYQGEYKKGETTMIVSRGLGFHTIPFRMFNPGDLVVVSFENGSEK
ncbi:MAG: metallophosphoesterase [Lachnospiraceae bacterium]|nr:metallophosphoesterase [Lachnospiraceae bacterium]